MHVITISCVLFLWMCTLTTVKSQACTRQRFIESKLYDANFDTTNLEESYPGGKQIRVGCKVGYTGFFKIICTQGEWMSKGTKCQPRSCGHPGDAQFADFHLEEGTDFVFASKVVYTCHQGYQMVSRINYRRCMAAGWDGVVPVCEAQQCPVISVDDNVQVNGDPEEATFGNVVRFSCKSNSEILVGPAEIYCDDNGSWSGNAPKCKAIKCETPQIENGIVHGNIREYNEHEVLHFGCIDKYTRTEERPSKCTKIGIRAEWSPTPLCEPVKCRLTLPPLEGTSYEPAYRNVFTPGEQVTVTCGEKYWISRPQDISAVTTCTDSGEWTVRPVCREVTCSNPRDQLVNYWGVYWNRKITLGDTVRYRCRSNFKSPDGSYMATCTRDGWRPNPLCQEITCEREDIPHANIVNPKTIYKNNQRAVYECEGDYKGRPTLTCGENGWTADSQCTEIICYREDIPHANIVNSKRRYTNNQQAFYKCERDYKGSPTLTCGENGWTADSQCTEIICYREHIPHANIVDSKEIYKNNERAFYKCEGDYKGSPTLTCGENGWTGDSQCTEIICYREHIPHASIVNSKRRYTNDQQAFYKCEGDYKGSPTLTCGENGWTADSQCTEITCEREDIPHANIVNPKEIYKNNQRAIYDCEGDYKGSPTLTCGENGWTGDSQCTKMCDKPVIHNADIIHNKKESYRHKEQVQFECKNSVEKRITVTCEQGNWTEIQSCAACPKPDVTNGFIKVRKDNYTLYYTCNTGYKLYTNGWWGEAKCLGSEWSGLESVLCIEEKQCGEIPAIPHGEMKPQHRAYEQSESIPINCETGYQAQDGRLICQEGNWTLNGTSLKMPTLQHVCTSSACGPPPKIENAVVKTSYQQKFLSGSEVTYQCRTEYTMDEGNTEKLQCVNGEWENKNITCTPLPAVPAVPAPMKIEDQ